MANAATYDYTGNPYQTAASPYTTSDFISGTMTFTAALPDNLPITTVFPTSFSFKDGVQTLTQANTIGLFNSFAVSTNATGNITNWSVTATAASCLAAPACFITTSPIQDNAQVILTGGFSAAAFGNNEGKWNNVAATPLPAALPLFATGLGAVGLLGWLKKRRSHSATAGAQGDRGRHLEVCV
jgi:hypothetical protein